MKDDVTADELANASDMTIETVTRVLTSMEKAGYYVKRRGPTKKELEAARLVEMNRIIDKMTQAGYIVKLKTKAKAKLTSKSV